MKLSDLTAVLSDKTVEFCIVIDDVASYAMDDSVDVLSDQMVYVKKSTMQNYQAGHFLTPADKHCFEQHSFGEYCCVINQIRGNILDITLFYDLAIKYESEFNPDGMAVAVVYESSVTELNDILRTNYAFSYKGETCFLLARHVMAPQKDTFLMVDAERLMFFSVTARDLQEINPEDSNDGGRTLVVEQAERRLLHCDQYSFFFYRAPIQFLDYTQAKRAADLTATIMNNGGSKYLQQWKVYAEKQMEIEQDLAEKAGTLKFSKITARDDKYQFLIDNDSNIPVFLKYAGNGKTEIQVKIAQTLKNGNIIFNSAIIHGRFIEGMNTITGRLKDVEDGDRLNYNLSGYLCLDLSGAEAVYGRRMNAFDALNSEQRVNSALIYLLEGRVVNQYEKKATTHGIQIDERIIKAHFGEAGPNDSQREAIEAALQTPDFAIIQGPPGTGKTKVITAIHAHLQAKQKNPNPNKDRYLLTAYQRDATENMASGQDTAYGLPIIAYHGGRESGGVGENVIRWSEQIKKNLSDTNNPINKEFGVPFAFTSKTQYRVMIQETRDYILGGCTLTDALHGIDRIIQMAQNFMVTEKPKKPDNADDLEYIEKPAHQRNLEQCVDGMNLIAGELKRRKDWELDPLGMYYIRKIPTSTQELSDNGEMLVNDIVAILGERLNHPEISQQLEILQQAAVEADCKKLKQCKQEIILLATRTPALSERHQKKLRLKIDNLLEGMERYQDNEINEIRADFLYGLEPTSELENVIKQYQQVVAATHQLSAKESRNYKDVLIDEAARSCPADLMIPLSRAENRIILVGDQKQLPQFVDDEVLKSIVTTESINAMFDGKTEEGIKASYKASMFKYLIDRAKDIAVVDPLHQRVVQLNVQYRMPPVLGSLVSTCFYDGKLQNSELPLSHFEQNYSPIEGKNLIWVNVTGQGTNEVRRGNGSIVRECEADVIVDYVDKIFASAPKKALKTPEIGIITFYAGQRDVLQRKIREKLGNEIANSISVGTVDAFQGKEFDIVFLSLVRQNSLDQLGFLESKNRMCVALSRAKKCLIVVGSSRILKYTDAKTKIPALIEALRCCANKEGGVCELRKS